MGGSSPTPVPCTPERRQGTISVPSTPFKTPKRDTREARLKGFLTPLSSARRGLSERSFSLVGVFRQFVLGHDIAREVQVAALKAVLANVWEAAKQAEASLDLSDGDRGAQDLHDSFRDKVRDKLTPSKDEPDDTIQEKRQAVQDNIDIVLELFVAVERLTGNAATNVIWEALKTSGDDGGPCAELQAYRDVYAQLKTLLETQLRVAGDHDAAAAVTREITAFDEKNKVHEIIGNICTRLYLSLQNALMIIAQPDQGADLPEWGQSIERVIKNGGDDITVQPDIEAIVNTLCFDLIKAEIAAHTAEMRARIRELQAALGQPIDGDDEVERAASSPVSEARPGTPSKSIKYEQQQASNSHAGLWLALIWLLLILIAALCAVFVKGVASKLCGWLFDGFHKTHITHHSADGLSATQQKGIAAGAVATTGSILGALGAGVRHCCAPKAVNGDYDKLSDADSMPGTPPNSRPPSRASLPSQGDGPLSQRGDDLRRRRRAGADMFNRRGTGYSP